MDVIVLILISIESPIGILLVPFAIAAWWMHRNRWAAILCAILAPGALAQAAIVLTSHSRQLGKIGASPAGLVTILGRQVFLAPLLGTRAVLHFALRYSPRSCFLLETVALLAGLMILFYALSHAPAELRLFIAFSFLVLAVSLARPLAGTPDQPQWQWMRFPGTANRYYFLPILAFLSSLLWVVDDAKSRAMRVFCISLLVLLPLAIRRDWRYPPFVDMQFSRYASAFQAAPSGATFIIPINPPPWKMALTKH
jgi:hypothetical protein